MKFVQLPKLTKGDKVAILSPSVAAPGKWPHVYELGLTRVREVFGLEPVEYPTTSKLGASREERARDLVDAFENPEIQAVIASLGGNDQITYIKNLTSEPFVSNPKLFFGFSDNTHFANHLWLNGISSFYGASLFTQFAMQTKMDDYTIEFINHALFDTGEFELRASETYNDISLDWGDSATLTQSRVYEPNEGWIWSGDTDAEGITWGGCLESIDELLRHGVAIPTLEQFENVVLMTETSEEAPTADYVYRVYRALGERGILERVKGVLVGRPKAWKFDEPTTAEKRQEYKAEQRKVIERAVREYNPNIPIVQNMDFGHTDPQVPMPYGSKVTIRPSDKKISIVF
ncbi:MAG: LD-carboxypeptidase [Candidatus Pacebacteria bacterium]|nr:LD-carboxypeptidase [Candidatus Paceibacterota bacterium]